MEYDLTALERVMTMDDLYSSDPKFYYNVKMTVYLLQEIPAGEDVYFTIKVSTESPCNIYLTDGLLATATRPMTSSWGSTGASSCVDVDFTADGRRVIKCPHPGSGLNHKVFWINIPTMFRMIKFAPSILPKCFVTTLSNYNLLSNNPLKNVLITGGNDLLMRIKSKAIDGSWDGTDTEAASPWVTVKRADMAISTHTKVDISGNTTFLITYNSTNTTLCPAGAVEFLSSLSVGSANETISSNSTNGSSLDCTTSAPVVTASQMSVTCTASAALSASSTHILTMLNVFRVLYGIPSFYPTIPQECFTVDGGGDTSTLKEPLSQFTYLASSHIDYQFLPLHISKTLLSALPTSSTPDQFTEIHTFELQIFALTTSYLSNVEVRPLVSFDTMNVPGYFLESLTLLPLSTDWTCTNSTTDEAMISLVCPQPVLPTGSQANTPMRVRFSGPATPYGSVWPRFANGFILLDSLPSPRTTGILATHSVNKMDILAVAVNTVMQSSWDGVTSSADLRWRMYYHAPYAFTGLTVTLSKTCALRFNTLSSLAGTNTITGNNVIPTGTSTTWVMAVTSFMFPSPDPTAVMYSDTATVPVTPYLEFTVPALATASFGPSDSRDIAASCFSFTTTSNTKVAAWTGTTDPVNMNGDNAAATVQDDIFDVSVDLLGHEMTSSKQFNSTMDVLVIPRYDYSTSVANFLIQLTDYCQSAVTFSTNPSPSLVSIAALEDDEDALIAQWTVKTPLTTSIQFRCATNPCLTPNKFLRFRIHGVVLDLSATGARNMAAIPGRCVEVQATVDGIIYKRPAFSQLALPAAGSVQHMVQSSTSLSPSTSMAAPVTAGHYAAFTFTRLYLANTDRLMITIPTDLTISSSAFVSSALTLTFYNNSGSLSTVTFMCASICSTTAPTFTITSGSDISCTPASPCYLYMPLTSVATTLPRLTEWIFGVRHKPSGATHMRTVLELPMADRRDRASVPTIAISNIAASAAQVDTEAGDVYVDGFDLQFDLPAITVSTYSPLAAVVTFSDSVFFVDGFGASNIAASPAVTYISFSEQSITFALPSTATRVNISGLVYGDVHCVTTQTAFAKAGVCASPSFTVTVVSNAAESDALLSTSRTVQLGTVVAYTKTPVLFAPTPVVEAYWLLRERKEELAADGTSYSGFASFVTVVSGDISTAAGGVFALEFTNDSVSAILGFVVESVTFKFTSFPDSIVLSLEQLDSLNTRLWTTSITPSSGFTDDFVSTDTLVVEIEYSTTTLLLTPLIAFVRLVPAKGTMGRLEEAVLRVTPSGAQAPQEGYAVARLTAPATSWTRNTAGASLIIASPPFEFITKSSTLSYFTIAFTLRGASLTSCIGASSVLLLKQDVALSNITAANYDALAGCTVSSSVLTCPLTGMSSLVARSSSSTLFFVLDSCVKTQHTSLVTFSGDIKLLVSATSAPLVYNLRSTTPLAQTFFVLPRVAPAVITSAITGTATATTAVAMQTYNLVVNIQSAVASVLCPYSMPVNGAIRLIIPEEARTKYVLDVLPTGESAGKTFIRDPMNLGYLVTGSSTTDECAATATTATVSFNGVFYHPLRSTSSVYTMQFGSYDPITSAFEADITFTNVVFGWAALPTTVGLLTSSMVTMTNFVQSAGYSSIDLTVDIASIAPTSLWLPLVDVRVDSADSSICTFDAALVARRPSTNKVTTAPSVEVLTSSTSTSTVYLRMRASDSNPKSLKIQHTLRGLLCKASTSGGLKVSLVDSITHVRMSNEIAATTFAVAALPTTTDTNTADAPRPMCHVFTASATTPRGTTLPTEMRPAKVTAGLRYDVYCTFLLPRTWRAGQLLYMPIGRGWSNPVSRNIDVDGATAAADSAAFTWSTTVTIPPERRIIVWYYSVTAPDLDSTSTYAFGSFHSSFALQNTEVESTNAVVDQNLDLAFSWLNLDSIKATSLLNYPYGMACLTIPAYKPSSKLNSYRAWVVLDFPSSMPMFTPMVFSANNAPNDFTQFFTIKSGTTSIGMYKTYTVVSSGSSTQIRYSIINDMETSKTFEIKACLFQLKTSQDLQTMLKYASGGELSATLNIFTSGSGQPSATQSAAFSFPIQINTDAPSLLEQSTNLSPVTLRPHPLTGFIGWQSVSYAFGSTTNASTSAITMRFALSVNATKGSGDRIGFFVPHNIFTGTRAIQIQVLNNASSVYTTTGAADCSGTIPEMLTFTRRRSSLETTSNDAAVATYGLETQASFTTCFRVTPDVFITALSSGGEAEVTLYTLPLASNAPPRDGSYFMVGIFNSTTTAYIRPLTSTTWVNSHPIQPMLRDLTATVTVASAGTSPVIDTVRTASSKLIYRLHQNGAVTSCVVTISESTITLLPSYAENSCTSVLDLLSYARLYTVAAVGKAHEGLRGSIALSPDETLLFVNFNNRVLVAIRRDPVTGLFLRDLVSTETFDLSSYLEPTLSSLSSAEARSASHAVAPFVFHDYTSSYGLRFYVSVVVGTRFLSFRVIYGALALWALSEQVAFTHSNQSDVSIALRQEQPAVIQARNTNSFVLCQRALCRLYDRDATASTSTYAITMRQEFTLSHATSSAALRPGMVAVGRALPWIIPHAWLSTDYAADDDLYYVYVLGKQRVAISRISGLRSLTTLSASRRIAYVDVVALLGTTTEVLGVAGVVPTGDGSAVVDVMTKSDTWSETNLVGDLHRLFFTFADNKYSTDNTDLPLVSIADRKMLSDIPVPQTQYQWDALRPRVSQDGRIYTTIRPQQPLATPSMSYTGPLTRIYSIRLGSIATSGLFTDTTMYMQKTLTVSSKMSLTVQHPRTFVAAGATREHLATDYAVWLNSVSATGSSVCDPTTNGNTWSLIATSSNATSSDFSVDTPSSIPAYTRQCSVSVAATCYDVRAKLHSYPSYFIANKSNSTIKYFERAIERHVQMEPMPSTLVAYTYRNCVPLTGATCDVTAIITMPASTGAANVKMLFSSVKFTSGSSPTLTYYTESGDSDTVSCSTTSTELSCNFLSSRKSGSTVWIPLGTYALVQNVLPTFIGGTLPYAQISGSVQYMRTTAVTTVSTVNVTGIVSGYYIIGDAAVSTQTTRTLRFAGVTADWREGALCASVWGGNSTRCMKATFGSNSGVNLMSPVSLTLDLPTPPADVQRVFLPSGDTFGWSQAEHKLYFWRYSAECTFNPLTGNEAVRSALKAREITQPAPMFSEGGLIQRLHVIRSTHPARGAFVLAVDQTGETILLRIDPRGNGFSLLTAKAGTTGWSPLSSGTGVWDVYKTQIGSAATGYAITAMVDWTDLAHHNAGVLTSVLVAFESGALVHYAAPVLSLTTSSSGTSSPKATELKLPLTQRSLRKPAGIAALRAIAVVHEWGMFFTAGDSGILFYGFFPRNSSALLVSGDISLTRVTGVSVPCSVTSLALNPAATVLVAGCSSGFLYSLRVTLDSSSGTLAAPVTVQLAFIPRDPTKKWLSSIPPFLQSYETIWMDSTRVGSQDQTFFDNTYTDAFALRTPWTTVNDVAFHPNGAHVMVLGSNPAGTTGTWSVAAYHFSQPIYDLTYTVSDNALNTNATWTVKMTMPLIDYSGLILLCRLDFPPTTSFGSSTAMSTSWGGASADQLTTVPPPTTTARSQLQFKFSGFISPVNVATQLSLKIDNVTNPSQLYDNLNDMTLVCRTPNPSDTSTDPLVRFVNGFEIARATTGTLSGMLLTAKLQREADGTAVESLKHYIVGAEPYKLQVALSTPTSDPITMTIESVDPTKCVLSATDDEYSAAAFSSSISVTIAVSADSSVFYMYCLSSTSTTEGSSGVTLRLLSTSTATAVIGDFFTGTFFVMPSVTPAVEYRETSASAVVHKDPSSFPAASDVNIVLTWNAPIYDATVTVTITSTATSECMFRDSNSAAAAAASLVLNIGTSNANVNSSSLKYDSILMACSQINAAGISITVTHAASPPKVNLISAATRLRTVYGSAFLEEVDGFNLPINVVRPFTVNIRPRAQSKSVMSVQLLRNSIAMTNSPCRLRTAANGTESVEISVTIAASETLATAYIICTQSFFLRDSIDVYLAYGTGTNSSGFEIVPTSNVLAYDPNTVSNFYLLDGTAMTLSGGSYKTSPETAIEIESIFQYAISRSTIMVVLAPVTAGCRFSEDTKIVYSEMRTTSVTGFSTMSDGVTAASGIYYTLDSGTLSDRFYVACTNSTVPIQIERDILSGDNIKWTVLPTIKIRNEMLVRTTATGHHNNYIYSALQSLILHPLTLTLSLPWAGTAPVNVIVTGPSSCEFASGSDLVNTIPTAVDLSKIAFSAPYTTTFAPGVGTIAIRMYCPTTSIGGKITFTMVAPTPASSESASDATLRATYTPYVSRTFNINGFYELTWQRATTDNTTVAVDVTNSAADTIPIPAGQVYSEARIRIEVFMRPLPQSGKGLNVTISLQNDDANACHLSYSEIKDNIIQVQQFTASFAMFNIYLWCESPTSRPISIRFTVTGDTHDTSYPAFDSTSLQPQGSFYLDDLPDTTTFVTATPQLGSITLSINPNVPQQIRIERSDSSADCRFTSADKIDDTSSYSTTTVVTQTEAQFNNTSTRMGPIKFAIYCRRTHVKGPMIRIISPTGSYVTETFGPYQVKGRMSISFTNPTTQVAANITDTAAHLNDDGTEMLPGDTVTVMEDPYFLRAPKTDLRYFVLQMAPALSAQTIVRVSLSTIRGSCGFVATDSGSTGTTNSTMDLSTTFQVLFYLGDSRVGFAVACREATSEFPYLIAEAIAGERYITALTKPMRVRGYLEFSSVSLLTSPITSYTTISFALNPVPLPTEETTIMITDGSAASATNDCVFRLYGATTDYVPSPFNFTYVSTMTTQDVAFYCRRVDTALTTAFTITALNDIYLPTTTASFAMRGAIWIEDYIANEVLTVAPVTPIALSTVRTTKPHRIRMRFRPALSAQTSFTLSSPVVTCLVSLTTSATTYSLTFNLPANTETLDAYVICSATVSEQTGVSLTLRPTAATTYYITYTSALFPVYSTFGLGLPSGDAITSIHIREANRLRLYFEPTTGLPKATQIRVSVPSTVAGECLIASEASGVVPAAPDTEWTSTRLFTALATSREVYFWIRCNDYTRNRSIDADKLPVLTVARESGELFWPLTTASFETYYTVCTQYSDLTNGVITTTASEFGVLGYGTVITYSCNTGYNLNTTLSSAKLASDCSTSTNSYGLSEKTCQQRVTCAWNGWDATNMPICSLHVCPVIQAPSNGSITRTVGLSSGESSYSATAAFSCSVGYQVEGATNITCTRGGWSAAVPQCLGVQCEYLEARNGVDVESVTYTSDPPRFTTVATYVCPSGYRAVSNNTRRCLSDGTWDGEDGVCTTSSCSPLLYDTERMVPVTYRNTAGVTLPARNPYDPNTTATYECKPGYEFQITSISHTAVRTCTDSTWMPIYVPVCTYKTCETLTRKYGTIVQDPASLANKFSVNLTMTCAYGTLPYASNLTSIWCNESGKWSANLTTCEPKNCGAPSKDSFLTVEVANGEFNFGENYNSSTAVYSCSEGYDLKYAGYSVTDGTGVLAYRSNSLQLRATRMCLPDGWTPSGTPSCAIHVCSAITLPANVKEVLYTQPSGLSTTSPTSDAHRIYNSTALYRCVTGYEPRNMLNTSLTHNATRTCRNIDVGWDNTEPVCIPYNCGPADEILYLGSITYDYDPTVTPTATSYLSKAIYTCASGFVMKSGTATATRQCLGAELGWSPAAPECIDVDECDANGAYYFDCAATYGSSSRCINTFGSFVCTPYVTSSPALEAVVTDQQYTSYMLNPELYPLPATVDSLSRTINPSDASGTQPIAFSVIRGRNLAAPYVNAVMFSNPSSNAFPGLLDYDCRSVTVTDHPTYPTTMLRVQCLLTPGQGMELYLRVQFCYAESIKVDAKINCTRWNWNWDGATVNHPDMAVNSNYKLRYPAPAFVASSLFSVTYDSGRTDDYVMPSVMGELIGFDVSNLYFDRPGLLAMYMGEATTDDDYPEECVVDIKASLDISTVNRTIVCLVPDMVNKANLRFKLSLAGHFAYSTDQLSYPQIPRVDSVTGCTTSINNEETGVISTTGCSTEGSDYLHVVGNAFIEPLTAFVHGRRCVIEQYIDSTNFYCRVPVGTGSNLTFIVKASTQTVQVDNMLSYGAPTIDSIEGCTMPQAGTATVVNCARQGGNVLVIRGHNFGYDGATVTIGGISCLYVEHDRSNALNASLPHRVVRCHVPPGTGLDQRIVLSQRYGAASTQDFFLSYVQCTAGTFERGYSCQACFPGEYNNRTGSQAQCTQCPSGTHAASYGSTQCESCPAGTYSPLGSATCILCPRGMFSGAKADRCAQCVPGTYASHEGSTACAKCGENAEQTIDYAYCQCKSGYYQALTGVCTACISGGDCSLGGTTAYSIVSLESYSPSAIQDDVVKAVRMSIDLRMSAVTTAEQAAVRAIIVKVLFDNTVLPQERVVISSISPQLLDADGFYGARVVLLITPAYSQNGLIAYNSTSTTAVSGGADSGSKVVSHGRVATASAMKFTSTWVVRNAAVSDEVATLLNIIMGLFTRPTQSDISGNVTLSAAETTLGDAYVAEPILDEAFARRPVSSFQECFHEACLSGSTCLAGHGGNLCTVCEPGYGHQSTFTCRQCFSAPVQALYLTASILAAILICAVLAWKQIVDGRKSTNELPAPAVPLLFKIAVSGIQIFAIAARYDVYWPGILRSFFDAMDVIGGLGTTIATLDCFLPYNSSIRPFWVSSIAIMLLPLVGILLPLAVLLLSYLLNRRNYHEQVKLVLKNQRRHLVIMAEEYLEYLQTMRRRRAAESALQTENNVDKPDNHLGHVKPIWDSVDESGELGIAGHNASQRAALETMRETATIAGGRKIFADIRVHEREDRRTRLRSDSDEEAEHAARTATAATAKRGGPLAPPGAPDAPAEPRNSLSSTSRVPTAAQPRSRLVRRRIKRTLVSSVSSDGIGQPSVDAQSATAEGADSAAAAAARASLKGQMLGLSAAGGGAASAAPPAIPTTHADHADEDTPQHITLHMLPSAVAPSADTQYDEDNAENLFLRDDELDFVPVAVLPNAHAHAAAVARQSRPEHRQNDPLAKYRAMQEKLEHEAAASAAETAALRSGRATAVDSPFVLPTSSSAAGAAVGKRDDMLDLHFDGEEHKSGESPIGFNVGDDMLAPVDVEDLNALASTAAVVNADVFNDVYIDEDGNEYDLRGEYDTHKEGFNKDLDFDVSFLREDSYNNVENMHNQHAAMMLDVAPVAADEHATHEQFAAMMARYMPFRKDAAADAAAAAASGASITGDVDKKPSLLDTISSDAVDDEDAANINYLTTAEFELLYESELYRVRAVRKERAIARVRARAKRDWYIKTYGEVAGRKMLREMEINEDGKRPTAAELRHNVDVTESRYLFAPAELIGFIVTSITVVMFVMHPNIAKQFFTFVSCHEIGGADWVGASYFLGDMTVPCWSSDHTMFFLALGLPMGLVWVFGLPIFACWYLYSNRGLIQMHHSGVSSVLRKRKLAFESRMAFLYRGYRTTRYYWFLAELFRKVVLVAIPILFPGAVHTQLILAALIVFLFIAAQVSARPFENKITEFVEYFSLFSSFMIFFLANFLFIESVKQVVKDTIKWVIVLILVFFILAVVIAFILLAREELEMGPLRRRIYEAHAAGNDVQVVIRQWRIARLQRRREKSGEADLKEQAKQEKRAARRQFAGDANTVRVVTVDETKDNRTAFARMFGEVNQAQAQPVGLDGPVDVQNGLSEDNANALDRATAVAAYTHTVANMVNSGVDVGSDAMTSYLQSARAMAGQDKDFNINLNAGDSDDENDGNTDVLVPNIMLDDDDEDKETNGNKSNISNSMRNSIMTGKNGLRLN